MILGALWGIWLTVNVITFALYGIDKRRARRDMWRISEKTLLLGTWLLGGVGALLGMRVFRHKTKHLAFRISAPVGALLSVAVMALATVRLTGLA